LHYPSQSRQSGFMIREMNRRKPAFLMSGSSRWLIRKGDF